jgi:hypothetical protein
VRHIAGHRKPPCCKDRVSVSVYLYIQRMPKYLWARRLFFGAL